MNKVILNQVPIVRCWQQLAMPRASQGQMLTGADVRASSRAGHRADLQQGLRYSEALLRQQGDIMQLMAAREQNQVRREEMASTERLQRLRHTAALTELKSREESTVRLAGIEIAVEEHISRIKTDYIERQAKLNLDHLNAGHQAEKERIGLQHIVDIAEIQETQLLDRKAFSMAMAEKEFGIAKMNLQATDLSPLGSGNPDKVSQLQLFADAWNLVHAPDNRKAFRTAKSYAPYGNALNAYLQTGVMDLGIPEHAETGTSVKTIIRGLQDPDTHEFWAGKMRDLGVDELGIAGLMDVNIMRGNSVGQVQALPLEAIESYWEKRTNLLDNPSVLGDPANMKMAVADLDRTYRSQYGRSPGDDAKLLDKQSHLDTSSAISTSKLGTRSSMRLDGEDASVSNMLEEAKAMKDGMYPSTGKMPDADPDSKSPYLKTENITVYENPAVPDVAAIRGGAVP